MSAVRYIDEDTRRMAGINLTASHVNAYEFCLDMLDAPTFDELLADFKKEQQQELLN